MHTYNAQPFPALCVDPAPCTLSLYTSIHPRLVPTGINQWEARSLECPWTASARSVEHTFVQCYAMFPVCACVCMHACDQALVHIGP